MEQADRCLNDPSGPRLVVVCGERGAGLSAFAHVAAERQRRRGVPVLSLSCVDGDQEYPLLLALRLVTAAQKQRSATAREHAADRPGPSPETLSAVEQGGRAALADTLLTALARSSATTVVVDGAQYADAASLAVLGGIGAAESAPGLRLMITTARGTAGSGRVSSHDGPALERLVADGASHTIVLPRLAPSEVADMVARRLQAVPDAFLVRRVHELTRGIPGAVDALLSGWSREDAIRVVDGHAFICPSTPVPVLPDSDRFMTVLHALGESCRAVADALSVLWPLGRAAATPVAELTGLSSEEVGDSIRRLAAAGLVDELHGEDGARVRGWMFRSPLVEHAVRERLGPLERGRLSAAVVRALWTAEDRPDARTSEARTTAILDEVDLQTYLPDRIVDAGAMVDRERAVTELSAAAEQLLPDRESRGMLRWLRATLRLVEEPAARELALLRYAKASHVTGDYRTAMTTAKMIVRNRTEHLTASAVQEAVGLLVVATAAEENWPRITQLGTSGWWNRLLLPAAVTVPAQAMALFLAERWKEALDLLSRNETLWDADPLSRFLPETTRSFAELAQGRPERFTRALALPEDPRLPSDTVYGVTMTQTDLLLGARDLSGAVNLLTDRGMPEEALPPHGRFLLFHLQGRWDDALALGRWMLATGRGSRTAPNHHLLAARTAAILLARGRIANADRLIGSVPRPQDGPLGVFLDAAEAEVLRTLGRPGEAEQALRRGMEAADARGHVYGTDELLAGLVEVHTEAGRAEAAMACLGRLERLIGRTNGSRTRLLYLLSSARVLRQDRPGDAHERLREAVELARSRSQPFETAVTLATAAAEGAEPPALLYEAYELFGDTGSALRRFHTRAAMRESGLSIPGRKQATAENEQLLATLIAEGLTNRQIATVLRISEDAVANRLSRLFARTGLRSRTEVVSAVLTGTLPTPADR